jgi:2-alkenal reductase
MRRFGSILLVLLFGLLVSLACLGTPGFSVEDVGRVDPTVGLVVNTPVAVSTTTQLPVPVGSSPPISFVSDPEETLTQLYDRVNPGVVAIRSLSIGGGSLGSGFVYDLDGHIITNYHVVRGETDLEVDFPSGYKTRSVVVGVDIDSDLAVLKVDAPTDTLFPLALGDSDQVRVGQTVVAIGNPFGLEGTMTIGIVSGLGRTLNTLHMVTGGAYTLGDVIQTDAAINPGNSGGPLLNLNGEVIGVNESILTNGSDRVNSGVGFAISSNLTRRIVPALIEYQKFEYPFLGISSLDELTLLQLEMLGLTHSTGVYVTQVVPSGPADMAGIQAGTVETSMPGLLAGGDLIIAVDGQEVLDFNDLIVYITKNKSPGDEVILTLLRGDELQDVALKLGRRPNK